MFVYIGLVYWMVSRTFKCYRKVLQPERQRRKINGVCWCRSLLHHHITNCSAPHGEKTVKKSRLHLKRQAILKKRNIAHINPMYPIYPNVQLVR